MQNLKHERLVTVGIEQSLEDYQHTYLGRWSYTSMFPSVNAPIRSFLRRKPSPKD